MAILALETMTDTKGQTRRRFLSTVTGIAGGATLASGAASAAQETTTTTSDEARNRATRQMLVPRLEPFAGNLVGQFILITNRKQKQASPTAVSNCAFPNWKAENTAVYRAMILDRLSDTPQYVTGEVYVNGTKPRLRLGQPFIVSKTVPCTNDYVGVEAQSVPPSVGEDDPAGPTVTTTGNGSGATTGGDDTTTGGGDATTNDGGQPGFGALAGAAGVVGGALLRFARNE